jgi:hypothetical protein
VLALLNLAASLLDPGQSYVEVGSFFGASLIGAMRVNEGDFVAIDRFSFDVPGTARTTTTGSSGGCARSSPGWRPRR